MCPQAEWNVPWDLLSSGQPLTSDQHTVPFGAALRLMQSPQLPLWDFACASKSLPLPDS